MSLVFITMIMAQGFFHDNNNDPEFSMTTTMTPVFMTTAITLIFHDNNNDAGVFFMQNNDSGFS